MRWLVVLIWVWGILFFSVSESAAALTLNASLNRSTTSSDDSVTLTLTVEGESSSLPEVQLTDLEDFRVVPAGTSTSVRFVNMRMSASRTQRFNLYPLREGVLTIPSFTVTDGNLTAASEALTLEVTESGSDPGTTRSSGQTRPSGAAPGTTAPPAQRPSSDAESEIDQHVFLAASYEPENPFVGQQVILTLTLYTAIEIADFALLEEPAARGFWKERLQTVRGNRRVTVDGVQMLSAEVARFALFPTTSGELPVSPAKLRIAVRGRSASRRPFGGLFDDDFFGLMSTRRFDIKSKPITVSVRDLPLEGRPDDFSGAVGRYSASISADQHELTLGDALTVQVKVEGEGNIKMIPDPEAPDFGGFTEFGLTTSTDVTPSPDGVSGFKTFDYVLLADEEGNYHIDPFRLNYFDPFRERYEEISTNSLDISINPGRRRPTAAVPRRDSAVDFQVSGRDISFIREPETPLARKKPLPLVQGCHPALHLLLALLCIASWLMARRLRHEDRGYRRRLRAWKEAARKFRKAGKVMAVVDMERYYGMLERLIREFVADCLDLDEPGMVMEDITGLLKARGVSDYNVERLLRLAESAGAGRYAPGAGTREGMKQLHNEAYMLLEQLKGELS